MDPSSLSSLAVSSVSFFGVRTPASLYLDAASASVMSWMTARVRRSTPRCVSSSQIGVSLLKVARTLTMSYSFLRTFPTCVDIKQ